MKYIFYFVLYASQHGFQCLIDAVNKEKYDLPPFSAPRLNYNSSKVVDSISQSYLQQFNSTHLGTPYSVSADGSCMFNAVSFVLCGSEILYIYQQNFAYELPLKWS